MPPGIENSKLLDTLKGHFTQVSLPPGSSPYPSHSQRSGLVCALLVVLNRSVSQSCQNSETREAGQRGQVRNLCRQALRGLAMEQARSYVLSMPFLWPTQLRVKERILNLATLSFHMLEGGKLLAQNHNRDYMPELEFKPGPV